MDNYDIMLNPTFDKKYYRGLCGIFKSYLYVVLITKKVFIIGKTVHPWWMCGIQCKKDDVVSKVGDVNDDYKYDVMMMIMLLMMIMMMMITKIMKI